MMNIDTTEAGLMTASETLARMLAERLYGSWASQQDLLDATPDEESGRIRPRPRWEMLDSMQKRVWVKIANIAIDACQTG